MRTLMLAIQSALQTGLAGKVRANDIFITQHVNDIPAGCLFPLIGIKDGPVIYKDLMGGCREVERTVRLSIFVKDTRGGANLITGDNGILSLTDTVRSLLDDNLLDMDRIILSASCDSESESQMYQSQTETAQQKIMNFKYLSQEQT